MEEVRTVVFRWETDEAVELRKPQVVGRGCPTLLPSSRGQRAALLAHCLAVWQGGCTDPGRTSDGLLPAGFSAHPLNPAARHSSPPASPQPAPEPDAQPWLLA